MKEEIETKHFEHTLRFEGTNRAAEPLLTTQVEMCAFHHNLSHGFYHVYVKFLFLFFYLPTHCAVRPVLIAFVYFSCGVSQASHHP